MTAKKSSQRDDGVRVSNKVTAADTAKPLLRPQSEARSKLNVPARLAVGDKLPTATLVDQQGNPIKMAAMTGKPVVVYFYPKDDTPGCTREACAFQAELANIARLGAQVFGISPDSASRHSKFAEKYGLKFSLLVDANREFADACGVLVPKTLYGKTNIGIERTTFLLNAKGVVVNVWRKVKVDGHVDDVVAAIRALGGK